MRSVIAWFLSVVLLPGAALYTAATTTAAPCQGSSMVARAAEQPLWQPPGEHADRPEPPPPRAREHREAHPLPPGAPEHRPRREAQAGSRPHLPRLQMIERLLPLVAERHPELAERLRRMREHSPEEFRRVLADALAMRLEEALQRHERRLFAPGGVARGPLPPRPPGGPEWDEPGRELRERHTALEREMVELQHHNEELERRSRELAQRFRELRQRRDREPEPELDEVRHHLEETVEEHFNVRTELRRIEFRRVEMQLDRLREVVERIGHDLERREDARRPIIERRLRQLLGEEGEDW